MLRADKRALLAFLRTLVALCVFVDFFSNTYKDYSFSGFINKMPGLASMDGISYGKPAPFTIPDYDYAPVKAAAKATDLQGYYDNLLDDAFDRDEEDFTYGVSPKITQRLVARAAEGFEWSEWRDKLHDMGDHYKVRTYYPLKERHPLIVFFRLKFLAFPTKAKSTSISYTGSPTIRMLFRF